MKVLFICGLFPSEVRRYIYDNSIYNVDSAADGFQQNILHGLVENHVEDLQILSTVFIGSYPKRFQKAFIRSFQFKWNDCFPGQHIGFLNFFGIKQIVRTVRVSWATWKWSRHATSGDSILIYSAHTPFVIAAWLAKKARPDLAVCLIIPDLPEYMNLAGSISPAVRLLKRLDIAVQDHFQSCVDVFVMLTKYMAETLPLKGRRHIVLEGIAQPLQSPGAPSPKLSGKVLLYTGTLTLAYGIRNLLDAFAKLEDPHLQLWICGGGEGEGLVRQRSALDLRIRFLGMVDRAASMDLQSKATLLINPRGPEGEYTKFSFPSKILEYLLSGRPTVTYPLPGIPEEYTPFYLPLKGGSAEAIAETLREALAKPEEELEQLGRNARAFVLTHKNPAVQIRRVLALLTEFKEGRNRPAP